MTIDTSAVFGISIVTLLALLGAAATASATWTKLGMRLEGLGKALTDATKTIARRIDAMAIELDDAVDAFSSRHERHSERMRLHELRLARLEDRAGIPTQISSDHTPVVSEPITGRHRRVRPEESEGGG